MGLNKLDNFIKNTEGRILYVSPADLDATDSIDNTGNSLARPFKTIQRAILESARFSYVKGNSNDLIEKTTILLMPGEHIVDNRPGFYIKNTGGQARTISRSGADTAAQTTLNLDLNTNFDLTQEDNILYKFNSVNGGVIVPRGTSLVGLDLRKTKIRPLYVPNPTDVDVDPSAIFRITGTCYFWQFSIFDGLESGTVYTDPDDFSVNNKSKPIFSHHKLTCFEYADGVNKVIRGGTTYDLTDLDMYYAKLSNAYNTGSGSPDRNIDSKYPAEPDGFAKQRPEWEIVGAFASDPISITSIEAGSGGVPNNQVTVTTAVDHELSAGTPIKITGVSPVDYNISTKVQNVDPDNPRVFTYLLPTFRKNLPTPGTASGAEVTIETDTVSGASPYIFNISMRSVYGLNGMLADGSKASGFRSMVVAQFTGVSLQKDDRAFVKYNKSSRNYDSIGITRVSGADLSNGSSSTNPDKIYHLDSEAIYRKGWGQTHIKITNDAILQIVSVFAIGYNKHFTCESGGDASITNSNSNFGQLSLVADGFKKTAFAKDNKAFITHLIPPRSTNEAEENIDWLSIDVGVTTAAGISTHLYLRGFESRDDVPPVLTQGYRIGAKVNDKLFVNVGSGTSEANIFMQDGSSTSFKEFDVTAVADSKLTIGLNHKLQTGEKVILLSDSADYPENIEPHKVYFVISLADATDVADKPKIQLASTKTDADNNNAITLYGGTDLRVRSRVTDKSAGEAGHPVQFDTAQSRWYITVDSSNGIYSTLNTLGVAGIGAETNPSFVKRNPDNRSLDEKIYKFRVVIPKELPNAKTPESGFIIQESSTTGFTSTAESSFTTIGLNNFEYNRNPRFISTCSHSGGISSVITELPHNLEVGEQIIITDVTDTNNTVGSATSGYNGTFTVASVSADNMSFTYANATGNPGTFNNNTSTRDINLPRYQRNDLQSNFYVYRNEVINEYIDGQQDGVYHIYALKADNAITAEFTDLEYGQNVTDLYPQTDRDNVNDNPASSKSRALSFPIGDVHTSDLKGSITRESADSFVTHLAGGLIVDSVLPLSAGIQTVTFSKNHTFAGVSTAALTSAGTGTRTNGTYYNVKLYNNSAYSSWNGATGIVSVTSNTIQSFQIQAPGSGYSSGDTLYFDNSAMGGNQDGHITLSNSGITTNIGEALQFTGISTISDAYYRITDVPTVNRVAIARTTGDPILKAGHIVLNVGPSIIISSSTFASGITTFTCSSAHGLVAGNKFRVVDSSNNNLGDYLVKSRVSTTVFTATTTTQLTSPARIFKHSFSSNSGVSDRSQENLAARQQYFYDGDTLIISNSGNVIGLTTTLIPVTHPNSGAAAGVGITERFPLGTYIQVDDEVMRVASSTLTGVNKITVLRGVFASNVGIHSDTSLIKKIRPVPVEFRRPSIIRASGHTFEYLGYGPGNYSTGLPQVQTRTLTEREEFLSQAQERSAGIVVYTGMNNRGDFYIGNTKKSSSTGEETSFDTPIPTVTGEDPARLSAIFDEITVKERIIVEGGDSRQILSQFDGPVTFGGEVRVKNTLSLTGKLKVSNTEQSNNTGSGAIAVDGGVGIGKNLYVGGESVLASATVSDLTDNRVVIAGTNGSLEDDANLTFNGSTLDIGATTESTSTSTGALVVSGGVGIAKNVNIGGSMFFPDEKALYFGNSDDFSISHIADFSSQKDSFGNDITPSSATVIRDDGPGPIVFKSNGGGGEGAFQFFDSSWNPKLKVYSGNTSGVELYHGNNGVKLETTSTGAKVTGTLLATTALKVEDSNHIYVGTGNDLDIYHNGNNTVIGNNTGHLYIRNNVDDDDGSNIYIQAKSGENSIIVYDDAGVSLYYNDNKKFETINTGAKVTGELQVTDDITAFYSSDERLKDNITPIDDPLAKVLSLGGYTFDWNENTTKEGSETGVIAQEVEALGLPGLITTRDNGYKAVRYEKLVPLLIEAIKELSDKVDSLEQKLKDK